MFLSLVSSQGAHLPFKRDNESDRKRWNGLWTTDIKPRETQANYSLVTVEKYCKKLKYIIGNDDSREDGSWALNCSFKWSRSIPETMHVKLSGKLLEKLYQLCGGNILLTLEADLTHMRNNRVWIAQPIKLTTREMGISSPSTVLSESNHDERSRSLESCSRNETFCEDMQAILYGGIADVSESDTLNCKFTIMLKLDSEYINYDGSDFDKMSACKNIFRNGIHSDVSIIAADGSVIPSHKCFLATQSSVLKVMLLEGNFVESKSNKITMNDVSKDCIMALLQFLYTWEITAALRSSELAVELFQVAHKYDIKPLENKLVNLFMDKENHWFTVDASIELFCFAKKIETKSDQLKAKSVLALKSKPGELSQSNAFKNIFTEDQETAMELCAMSLQSS